MKELFITAIMLFSLSLGVQAQSVVREGNTFKSATKSYKVKTDTLLTSYMFEDSKGLLYPIVINKQNGRCWIWKKSGKTGKMYKSYMKEGICKAVCEELNILYMPKK